MTTKTTWKQGKFWRWSAISLVVLAGVFFLVQLTQANPASEYTYPAPSIDYISPLEDEINTYREMLNDDRPLDEQMRQSLEEKLAMAERRATQMAPGQPPRNPDQTPVLIPVVTDPPFPTGIFEGGAGAFRPSQARIQNRWQGIVNGDYAVVFAGALANDPEQGIVYIQWMSFDRRSTTWGYYPTPEKSGSVRIVQAEGARLILTSDDGKTFYFDVPVQVYVSSLTEIALTPTPAPIYPYP